MPRFDTRIPHGSFESKPKDRSDKLDLLEEATAAAERRAVSPFNDEDVVLYAGTDDGITDNERGFNRIPSGELEIIEEEFGAPFSTIEDIDAPRTTDNVTVHIILARVQMRVEKVTGFNIEIDSTTEMLEGVIAQLNCKPDAVDEIVEELTADVFEQLITQGLIEREGGKIKLSKTLQEAPIVHMEKMRKANREFVEDV